MEWAALQAKGSNDPMVRWSYIARLVSQNIDRRRHQDVAAIICLKKSKLQLQVVMNCNQWFKLTLVDDS